MKKIFYVLLFLYCVAALANIAAHPDAFQWDFPGYYYSAKAQSQGANPYDVDLISKMAGRQVFPYVYSPLTLLFFRLFTPLDYAFASALFLIIKCVLLFGLISLWRNQFLGKKAGFSFYLLCLFAFNSAIYLDFRAGNISIIEQSLLWLGFFCYLKRRFILFCALIILAATFKFQPILFLSLLFFTDGRKKYVYFLVSLSAFAVILFTSYLLDPFISQPLVFSSVARGAFRTSRESGAINPSTFALIRDLLYLFKGKLDTAVLDKAARALYFMAVCGIVLASRLAYARIRGGEGRERQVIFFSCLVYALVSLRFKDYSYILLVVPAYFIIMNAKGIKASWPFLFMMSISAVNITSPGADIAAYFLWNYYPLLTAFLIWGLYLYEYKGLKLQLPKA